jgi:hypothetical protein
MRPAEPAHGGLLLVPVSGSDGSGELQRARLLARSARARWPRMPIAIAAAAGSLEACSDAGVEYLPLPGSPTRCTREVTALIGTRRPALVLFDSTARPAQLAAARAVGAGVVYLSSRPSARRRGFRPGAFAHIDEHWSVEFDPDRRLPGALQRLVLRLRPALRWRAFGTLHEPADAKRLPPAVRDFIAGGPFALFCPGGGGGQVAGLATPAAYAQAAVHSGLRATCVRADRAPGSVELDGPLLTLGPVDNAALIALVERCAIAVLAAGSLLIQAVSCGTPCIAAPLADDQRERLQLLAAREAVIASEASVAALADAASKLWLDSTGQARLRQRATALGLSNGLDHALNAMTCWLGPATGG